MRRVSTITVIAGMAIGLTVPAAGAATGHGKNGWEPFRTQPFDSVGRCSFTVHGDIVRDEEEVRTLATFPDGTPRVQEFRGPLVIRFTNTSTGASVVRDVSGYGRLRRTQDGGSVWYFDGGASVGVPIGNTAFPAGSYVIHGRFRLVIRPDGTRELPHLHADVENLCQTLA
jgi:hypothetical protein